MRRTIQLHLRGGELAKQPIADHVVDRIHWLWLQDNKQTAKMVWIRNGRQPSLRKVQQIIKAVRPRVQPIADDPLLKPWDEHWSKYHPEEIAVLYDLLWVTTVLDWLAPPLDTRTARWALKLRGLFDTQQRYHAYSLLFHSFCFATRERAAEVLCHDSFDTDDLDASLTFRAWESGENNKAALAMAGELGRTTITVGLNREAFETLWGTALNDQLRHDVRPEDHLGVAVQFRSRSWPILAFHIGHSGNFSYPGDPWMAPTDSF